jgi:heat shock protein HslJ
MASEAAYLAALAAVETAERTGDRLTLAGPDVELLYMLEPPAADLPAQDEHVIGVLGEPLTVAIEGNRLTLTCCDLGISASAKDRAAVVGPRASERPYGGPRRLPGCEANVGSMLRGPRRGG